MYYTLTPSSQPYTSIANDPNAVSLSLGDDSEANVTLPFSFDFYGTLYNQITVGSNGGIVFATNAQVSPTNTDLPTNGPDGRIYPWWDDWVSNQNVYYLTSGTAPSRIFTVEWFTVRHFSGSQTVTFKLELEETTGTIRFKYGDVICETEYTNGVSGTIGIEAPGPQSTREFLKWSFNTASLTNNLCLEFVNQCTVDTEPPVITCPDDIVVLGNDSGGTVVNYDVTATDNCPVTVTCTPTSGSVFGSGITPVNCVATDSAGYTNACSFKVTVLVNCLGTLVDERFAYEFCGTGVKGVLESVCCLQEHYKVTKTQVDTPTQTEIDCVLCLLEALVGALEEDLFGQVPKPSEPVKRVVKELLDYVVDSDNLVALDSNEEAVTSENAVEAKYFGVKEYQKCLRKNVNRFLKKVELCGSPECVETLVTTTFAGGNSFNGNMFDIQAQGSDILILKFDQNFVGSMGSSVNFEIWYRPESYLSVPNSTTSSAGWTQIGAVSVISAGEGNPTPIPIDVNILIPAGETYGFYLTGTNGSVRYTNGTVLGAEWNPTSGADENIKFFQGHGGSYFNVSISPRVWNGNIYYCVQ